MANPTYPNSGYETLVAAASRAQENLKFPNRLLERVYLDYDPDAVGRIGQTLNAVIPLVNQNNSTNIAGGNIVTSAITDFSVPIVLNTKWSSSRVVPAFFQTLSGINDLADKYLQPAIEENLRNLNSSIGNLITFSNFNVYPFVNCSTGTITRSNLNSAWSNLYSAGVPINDGPADVTLAVNPTTYAAMMADTTFLYSYIAGESAATNLQQRAMIADAVLAAVIPDPAVPVVSSSNFAALYFHRYAIALRCVNEYPIRDSHIMEYTWEVRPGVPMTVQTMTDITQQGLIMNVNNLNGVAVVRPEMANYMLVVG
jgi:hypothetical protein